MSNITRTIKESAAALVESGRQSETQLVLDFMQFVGGVASVGALTR